MNLLASLAGVIIVEVLIVVVIGVFCFFGCKNGFIKSLISTFGSLFAIIIAVLLCTAVSSFLETKFNLMSSISNGVSGVLVRMFGEDIMLTSLREASEASLIDSNLSTWIIKIVLDVKGAGDIPLDYTVSDIVSPVFGYYITCTISVIGIFIIARIALFLVGEIVKDSHECAIVGVPDKLLGLLFGLIKGIIVVQIAFLIIRVIPLGLFQQIMHVVDQSAIAKFINNTNLFALILELVSRVNLVELVKATIIK